MSIAETAVGLTAAQLENARIIEREFAAAGVPGKIIAAAIVNAWAESRLNANAMGDNGHSVGLFQLYDRGAGAEMTVAERQNPTNNTKRILQEYMRYGAPIMAAEQQGATIYTLTGLFAKYIERPANAEARMVERGGMSLRLFPDQTLKVFEKSVHSSPKVWLVASGLVTFTLIMTALRSRKESDGA